MREDALDKAVTDLMGALLIVTDGNTGVSYTTLRKTLLTLKWGDGVTSFDAVKEYLND